MATSGARGHADRQDGAGSRMLDRASERARGLHRMRGALMIAISVIVAGEVVLGLLFVSLVVLENPLAARFGSVFLAASLVTDLIILFIAWMTLEALGRIERETDRVQQFMDNVYRRLS